MISIMQKIGDTKKNDKNVTFHSLIKCILVGSLVILFIGVSSFAVLFITMYLI